MRARALANKGINNEVNTQKQETDPRELLRQRREAIRAKALAAKSSDDEE